MMPGFFLSRILDPGLDWVATHGSVQQNRAAARPWMLAVALQESALVERYQILDGGAPGAARSWWQVEEPTVRLLLRHEVTGPRLRSMCDAASVRHDPICIWRAIEGHDMLAVGVARLLLLADPHPVPVDEAGGWECYMRVWRPGKPRPEKWGSCWRMAQQAIGGG